MDLHLVLWLSRVLNYYVLLVHESSTHVARKADRIPSCQVCR